MNDTPEHRPPGGPKRLWVVLGVLSAIVAGTLVARLLVPPVPSAPRAPAPVADPRDESPEARRQRLGGIDSTQKNAWVEEIPGVNVSRLDPARLEAFVRFANAQRCTCGCGFTLAACRRYDSECEVSGPRVQRLADSIASGPPRDLRGLRPRPAKSAG